jgi:hypothetical protein
VNVGLTTKQGHDVSNRHRPIDPRSKATDAASDDYLASDGHPEAVLLGQSKCPPGVRQSFDGCREVTESSHRTILQKNLLLGPRGGWPAALMGKTPEKDLDARNLVLDLQVRALISVEFLLDW